MLRPTRIETAIAVAIGLVAFAAVATAPPGSLLHDFSRTLLIGWLAYYAVVFGAAPLLSLVARPRARAPPTRDPKAPSSIDSGT